MNPNSHQVHILYSVHFLQQHALETLIAMVIIYRLLIGDKIKTALKLTQFIEKLKETTPQYIFVCS